MTLFISMLVIVLIIIYIFAKSQKPKHQQNAKYDIPVTTDTSPLKRQPMSPVEKTNFVPYKIVENDNSLRTIVDDYDRREIEAIKDFETRLGKALPNDVIWSILQDLIIECWETTKNKKILVNTEYQMGLLLQKEKKYKDAISHYSMGLYYLINFYGVKNMNPRNHLIDCITSDIEVLEMGQYKFTNKIKLCSQYDSLTIDELLESMKHLITTTALRNVTPSEFINMYQSQLPKVSKSLEEKKENIKSEYNEGMSHVREYNDGRIEVSSNKEHGLISEGAHYTDSIEDIKLLKRQGKNKEVIELLLKATDAVKNEKKHSSDNFVTAPWYFEQLAIMYRKEKQYDKEVELIKSFIKITKDERETTRGKKIYERLDKALQLANNSK